eukprot:10560284-Lingulodinium_polyedra.AAC.1
MAMPFCRSSPVRPRHRRRYSSFARAPSRAVVRRRSSVAAISLARSAARPSERSARSGHSR